MDQNVPLDQERGNGNTSSAERGELPKVEEAQDTQPSQKIVIKDENNLRKTVNSRK